jgi:hydrophobic/amphiphilic exporter-1 (mainly G- bacteria), HAE1 family
VSTPYPGAGPEEVEELVTEPIEDAVSSLAGIEGIESVSREGLSQVTVRFAIGTDIKLATLDVRDRVFAAHRAMPSDVQDPSFLRLDPDAIPVQTLVLGGEADPRELRRFADEELRPILEQAEGVGRVSVRGGAVREIGIEVYAASLAHYGVTVDQVSQALAIENVDVPAGRISSDDSETVLRLEGQFRSLDDIRGVVVSRTGSEFVRVRDVADVVDRALERRTLVRVNGKEAVALEVVKQSGGNTVAVADAVAALVEDVRLPTGWTLDVVVDSAEFIRDNTREVELAIVLGGFAAIAVVWLFMLDWRSTFISSLALPTSVVATFFGLWVAGFSLNMMTLLALSLAIGFLIDDAIVVRENIFRHLEAGEDPVTAASRGTREIALAVIATTSTILAVFVPVAFMSGMVGQFFWQFGWTVAIAVSVSLFVAFTLDPMLSARLVRPRSEQPEPTGRIRRMLMALDSGYRDLLGWALRHRVGVVFLAVVLFVASLGTVGLMGSEFVAKSDRGQFSVQVVLPPGSSLDHTAAAVAELEKMVLADPDARLVYATIGVDGEARRASLRVTTNGKNERERTLPRVMQDLRRSFGRIPGIQYSFQEVGFVESQRGTRDMPVILDVRGPDFTVLEPLARRVAEIVRTTPGIVDQDTTWAVGSPEIRIVVDREEASRLGVSAGIIGRALRGAIVGDIPTRYRDGKSEWDVRVRLREEDRNDRTQIEALPVPTLVGPVPVRQVASLVQGVGPSSIERDDRQRVVTVSANVLGRSLGEVATEIEARLAEIPATPGYTVAFAGETEDMRDTLRAFAAAAALAVVFTYIVLASQFESLVHPFTILASLPLAIVGALLALFLTGNSFGLSASIGILLLMGLVTKNAILLVDATNQLRDERGYDVHTALQEAGPRRLRPILMTSAAMVLGMLPSALSNGAGSEFRAPMAIAVIGGVITSTALTLVVVPVLYSWFDRFTLRHRRTRKKGRPTISVPPRSEGVEYPRAVTGSTPKR